MYEFSSGCAVPWLLPASICFLLALALVSFQQDTASICILLADKQMLAQPESLRVLNCAIASSTWESIDLLLLGVGVWCCCWVVMR